MTDDKDLYRVTVAVRASDELTVVCREYVEARGAGDAEQEAILALDRRWKLAHEAERYVIRSVERGRFWRVKP